MTGIVVEKAGVPRLQKQPVLRAVYFAGAAVRLQASQTLQRPFSAVSTLLRASQSSLERFRRDLPRLSLYIFPYFGHTLKPLRHIDDTDKVVLSDGPNGVAWGNGNLTGNLEDGWLVPESGRKLSAVASSEMADWASPPLSARGWPFWL